MEACNDFRWDGKASASDGNRDIAKSIAISCERTILLMCNNLLWGIFATFILIQQITCRMRHRHFMTPPT